MAEYLSGTKTASAASKSAASSSYGSLNAEGHPAYFVRGSAEANRVIQWNKNQKYSTEYIKKIQRTVGSADDGDIGTNTINAIRDYQVKNHLSLDGKWGNECATCANLPREYASGQNANQNSNQNANTSNQNSNQNANTSNQNAANNGGNAQSSQTTSNYFVKGSAEANKVIQWNKSQNYSTAYIKKLQRAVGTSDDGDIGTNTINAIRNYQVQNNLTADGKWGNECATCANLPREYASGQTANNNQTGNTQNQNTGNSGGSPLPKINWMSDSYTPDLSVLKAGADYENIDVKNVGKAAKYVADNCMSSKSLSQCTRGTALFMQLASYARGEASSRYHSACKACDYGNGSSNGNVSSSVSSEYSETDTGLTRSNAISGNGAFDRKIEANLSKDGDYVTFQYANSSRDSYHIVFKSGSNYYSDFAQGTPCGIRENSSNIFWNVKYYNH